MKKEVLKATLFTLGCKLNQFETAYIANLFEEKGFEILPFPAKADVSIVNTCTVTAKSEYHSRQAVRRAIRKNPEGMVIVTGCAAQINPMGFGEIPGVGMVLGNMEKSCILKFFEEAKDAAKKGYAPFIKVSEWDEKKSPIFPMSIKRFVDYTRAFIKVQEGCDAHCSYCIVPMARGPARSASIEEVVAQAGGLWEEGYKEIVLTGIHLGQYGRELTPAADLETLLERLINDTTCKRLRLSSIEPNEFTMGLLDLVAGSSAICPHFHIPLQSGSKRILRLMRRGYTPGGFKALVYRIFEKIPHAAIGADVMVGFPGETEEDFGSTFSLIETLPLAYLHVFSYSPRPETPASIMKDQVDGLEKKRRSLALRLLGQKKREAFRLRFIDRRIRGLILNQEGPEDGCRVALLENYIPVYVKAGKEMVNHMAYITIERVSEEGTWGNVSALLD